MVIPISNKLYYLVGGFYHLEKYKSQWEGLSHVLWKINNVWNYHPAIIIPISNKYPIGIFPLSPLLPHCHSIIMMNIHYYCYILLLLINKNLIIINPLSPLFSHCHSIIIMNIHYYCYILILLSYSFIPWSPEKRSNKEWDNYHEWEITCEPTLVLWWWQSWQQWLLWDDFCYCYCNHHFYHYNHNHNHHTLAIIVIIIISIVNTVIIIIITVQCYQPWRYFVIIISIIITIIIIITRIICDGYDYVSWCIWYVSML